MSFILSAKTITLPTTFDEDQIRVDIGVREIPDAIVYGRITECDTDTEIVGATVALWVVNDDGTETKLCHTFSGCNGFYMLRIPPLFEGATIRITATADNCSEAPEPCECELEPPVEE